MIAANRGNAFSKSIALDFQKRQKAFGEKPVVVVWPPNCPTGVVVWLVAQLVWCGGVVAAQLDALWQGTKDLPCCL